MKYIGYQSEPVQTLTKITILKQCEHRVNTYFLKKKITHKFNKN